ncbi:GTPase-associated system all-helical protein GASH [Acidicapsa ligni]|uniref:GTPase-associated system all-helical protein GASH n=1 Tax=Acidicapsa ligni TaxID=542300 RepID=UPI0021E048A9|nr:GTPase-associated system all-helical protein GASH [Acidicapsa ligni]
MNIAQHVRIFDKTPTDELVEKRTEAIGTLAGKYKDLASVDNLLLLAADLTKGVAKGGSLPEARVTEVEAAIKEKSTSFVREGQDLEILTCALLAALKWLEDAAPTDGVWSRQDVLALGLWSGLGFQIPRTEERLEALRLELLGTARNLVLASSGKARTRQEVPAVTVKMPEAYDTAKVVTAIQNGVAKAIDALRVNAALDREEIDLLWWVLSDWSKFSCKSLSALSETAAVVVAGLEAGSIVRRIPGEAHKQLILRLLKQDKKASMQEVLDSIKVERERIATFFENNHLLTGRESLFPLVSACITGKAGGKAAGAHSLDLSDWAARALLESAILHVGRLPRNLV